MEIIRLDVIEFSELCSMIEPLVAESVAEGFRILQRLATDFESRENPFQGPDEALFGVVVDDRLVGVGGLNVDPYRNDPLIGRVRRVYVSAASRRIGVGRALLSAIVDTARTGRFIELTLRTDDDRGAAFYHSLGFERVEGQADSTHRVLLCRP